MYDIRHHHLLCIVYDSVTNSVFSSQVVTPLLERLEANKELEITLVTYERTWPSEELLLKKVPAHERLHLVIGKKQPYWGSLSLKTAVRQCFELLMSIPCDEIIARGPLAGYVASQALIRLYKKLSTYKASVSLCSKITIQARGLCAEEYLYAARKHHHKKFPTWIASWGLYWSFYMLEKMVYQGQLLIKNNIDFSIESVSKALSEYLIAHYACDPTRIIIAQADIPQPIDEQQRAMFRKEKRSELGIADDAIVYCYSGSFKPWQCAEETIVYFSELQKSNPQALLLILSADKEDFYAALTSYKVSTTSYRLLSVSYEDLFRYLAAADFGILLREKSIVNWVSRPTKMLEYQAVGLRLIHNNSIGWLTEEQANKTEKINRAARVTEFDATVQEIEQKKVAGL